MIKEMIIMAIHYLGKHEILGVLVLTIAIGIVAAIVIFSSGLLFSSSYDSIDVRYSYSGNYLVIEETFDMSIIDSFNVLYRSFAQPSCIGGDCEIIVESVECQTGTPYYASTEGRIIDPKNSNEMTVSSLIRGKIKENEVGCFLEEYYSSKKERLKITYRVPLETVEYNGYRHKFFSEDHFPIYQFSVTTPDGEKSVKANLQKDAPVTVDIRTGQIYGNQSNIILVLATIIIALLVPYAIWRYFGTEKKFTVPEYLHVVPEKGIESWKVDVLTNGTGKLSKNGLASMLVNLYTRNIIDIEEKKSFLSKKAIINIVKNYKSLNLESKEVDLLDIFMGKKKSEDKHFYYCEISDNDRLLSLSFKEFFNSLQVKKFNKQIMDNKGYWAMFVAAILSVIAIVIASDALLMFMYLAYPMIFGLAIVAFSIPMSVFSRFRGDYYRKYLEWLAFKNMLEDYAQIKRYLKEDYSIWKDWLIYATALGSAKNLLKSMKELKIIDPNYYDKIYAFHHTTLWMAAATSPRSGGGVGGGGGFGGGGGGGR